MLGSLYHLSRPQNPSTAIGRFPRTGKRGKMMWRKGGKNQIVLLLVVPIPIIVIVMDCTLFLLLFLLFLLVYCS